MAEKHVWLVGYADYDILVIKHVCSTIEKTKKKFLEVRDSLVEDQKKSIEQAKNKGKREQWRIKEKEEIIELLGQITFENPEPHIDLMGYYPMYEKRELE